METPAARASDLPGEAAAGAPLAGRELGLVIGALMLGMLKASLDQTIVSTALPTIVGELGGLQHPSWVVTAHLLADRNAARTARGQMISALDEHELQTMLGLMEKVASGVLGTAEAPRSEVGAR